VRPDYRRLKAAGHDAAPGQAGAPRQGPGALNTPAPPSVPTLGREPTLKRCAPQVGSVNANGSFEQHDPPHGTLIYVRIHPDLARPGGRMDVRRCRVGAAYAAVATLFRYEGSMLMAEDSDPILNLAAQIVAAHVSANSVTQDQLPKLISDVHDALATAALVAAEQPKLETAVPVTKSVFHDHIVCIDCGKSFTSLRRHLTTSHDLTAEQYRQRWDLPSSYPMVCPDYTKTRSSLAKKIGSGHRVQSAPMKTERKRSGRG
jgi:predicted transcriptional regulator